MHDRSVVEPNRHERIIDVRPYRASCELLQQLDGTSAERKMTAQEMESAAAKLGPLQPSSNKATLARTGGISIDCYSA